MAFVQLVSFELCGEEYAVDINMVNGIIKCKSYKIFKIPNAPAELEGCINLRGKVSPIFNLKKKFQCGDDSISDASKIIVIDNGGSTVGFIVDEVTDIFKLKDEEIEPVPGSISGDCGDYMKGIGKIDDRVILIIDLIKALSDKEAKQLQTISSITDL